MSKELIMVSSVTYAMKGRDLLRLNGYKAYVERTPGKLDHKGCGYSIFVTGDIDSAEKLLKNNNIKVLGRINKGVSQ